ncbi:hypothetical protein A4A49_66169 [Nicotiana attenuata]|uniref:Uncharacterized protein n=1 Tax=Nicotiana attenuata TaxID=49451 RepID=A0A1J6I828_NICAT|nr:hypothetical protein A4A49_60584 [Nicotiana attenuata]OIS97590.1 hypothetical protein A4A49_62317 [Nicotiana attenuata]OIT18981.1 hypothetical protein A4A49_06587 [Nicotiana attenuata]OIT39690.1 hypothetical protein A4A49_66169 [Nicotiana attenuata]
MIGSFKYIIQASTFHCFYSFLYQTMPQLRESHSPVYCYSISVINIQMPVNPQKKTRGRNEQSTEFCENGK